ncbi:unnamed protein product [Paramecium sonneborni]|uniref:Uncharacterized protein n=1 Tax=Paramecium sonneborni TaxID=65129 RepID=A0A8S1RT18_9CILI|nr:unnamed protein product [Paramecium sonneborni]
MFNCINEKLQNNFCQQIDDNAQKNFQSENLAQNDVDFCKNDRIITEIEKFYIQKPKGSNSICNKYLEFEGDNQKINQTKAKYLQDILIDKKDLTKQSSQLISSQKVHKFEQNII